MPHPAGNDEEPGAELLNRPLRFRTVSAGRRRWPLRWYLALGFAGLLAADLHFFHGPLWHLLARLTGHSLESPSPAPESPVFEIKVETSPPPE